MKYLIFLPFLLSFHSCSKPARHYDIIESTSTKEKFIQPAETETWDDVPVGDCLLYQSYLKLLKRSRTIDDSMDFNPLEGMKGIKQIKFEVESNSYDSEMVWLRSKKLVFNKGQSIEFFQEGDGQRFALFNNKLFATRRLFGELFSPNSEVIFHYDTGRLYQLSNGNFLYLENPASWCGLANQYNFCQLFDLKKGELFQFVERDEFINSLK